ASMRCFKMMVPVLLLSFVAFRCADQGAHLRAQPVMFMETSTNGTERTIPLTLPPLDETAPSPAPGHVAVTQVSSLGAIPLPQAQAGSDAAKPTEPGKLDIKCVRAASLLRDR